MPRKPVRRPGRRSSVPIDRPARAREAAALFNDGKYWEAHEVLEAIWRSIDDDEDALVVQGLIQATAALLHRERGNQHGVRVVGRAALEKLAGKQNPAIEFETERFGRRLKTALDGGPVPLLELR